MQSYNIKISFERERSRKGPDMLKRKKQPMNLYVVDGLYIIKSLFINSIQNPNFKGVEYIKNCTSIITQFNLKVALIIIDILLLLKIYHHIP